MKMFTITKTGYSAGVYGCSAEYFTCIFTHKDGLRDLMNARAQLWKNITSNGREAQSYYIGQRSIIEQILDKYFGCNY